MEQRKAVELNSALTMLGFGAWSELESSKCNFNTYQVLKTRIIYSLLIVSFDQYKILKQEELKKTTLFLMRNLITPFEQNNIKLKFEERKR